ncbi:adenine phosphoribosyltransferase [Ornithinicoccus hortensis]|uniref:Adenine phosphoribosyltransferase n=1 Tax=Ornithinicoccus hortensis TaxID=82346 RepID=A0A542YTD3_9MICO|nr:adenine phosphoribosyltransferase [Ornithinicoccus hortensis]TQL51307.1 adenine phosphoribosyltransferase [Ornithinicoccus hortensis]
MSSTDQAGQESHHDESLARDVDAALRSIPDFPEPGVVFKDFTPVLLDPALRTRVVRDVVRRHRGGVDVVVGIEARGFIIGAVVAHELEVGFALVRKEGKLPGATHSVSYDLEYGSATVEVHEDAIRPAQRVLVVDDVLATGGTAAATCDLVERCGGSVVGVEVVLELGFLDGRSRLGDYPVTALLTD